MNRSWKPALCILAACGALSLLAAPASAEEPWTLLSPWTLNRSGYFVQGTFSYLSTGSLYDAVGEKQENPAGDYRDFTANTHVEYGVRDRLGLLFHIPVRSLSQQYEDTPDLTTTGIGDFTGGLRYRILDGSFVVSAQGELKLSTGYNASVTSPALGDGQTDYTIRALAGRAFAPKPLFTQAVVGDIQDYFKGGLGVRYRAYKTMDVAVGVFQTFGGIDVPAGTQFYLGISYKGNRLGKYDGLLTSAMDPSGAPVPARQPGAEAAPPAAPETPAQPAPVPAPPPTPTPGNP